MKLPCLCIAALAIELAMADPTAMLAETLRIDVPLHGELGADCPPVESGLGKGGARLVGARFRLEVEGPGPHVVDLRSHFFDAYLVLRDGSGGVLLEDDDGLLGTHARIEAVLEAGGSYEVEVCAPEGEGGLFELTLARGAAPALTPLERRAALRRDAERAVEVTEELLGPRDPQTLARRSALGLLLWQQGEHAAALPSLRRTLALHEEVLGPDDVATGDVRNNLGLTLIALGDYRVAAEHLERAVAISEATRGPDHRYTVIMVGNLGLAFREAGEYERARELLERSVRGRERAFGPDSPSTATGLNNLAGVLRSMGEYEEARSSYERALGILEAALGPDHPSTAGPRNNLAWMHHELGDAQGAIPLFEQSLALCEAHFGPEHPDTAMVLWNLAKSHHELQDHEAALPLFERSLEVSERTLGPNHPQTHGCRAGLAGVLACLQEHERAVGLLESTAEAAGASDDPVFARPRALLSLARGELHRGEFERAFRRTSQVVELLDETNYLHVCALACLGRPAEAWAGLRELRERWIGTLDRGLYWMSEAEVSRFLADRKYDLEIELGIAPLLDDDGVEEELYDHVLEWKGSLARHLASSRSRAFLVETEAEQALLRELRACQTRLSSLLRGVGAGRSEAGELRLERLRRERNRLEVELGKTVGVPQVQRHAGPAALRATLPAGSALVDFIVLNTYRPGASAEGRVTQRSGHLGEQVIAWITRPDRPRTVRVDLGASAALERAVEEHRARMAAGIDNAGRGLVLSGRPSREASQELWRLLWDPLAPHLDGVDTVVVSPDRYLATLPLGTLQGEDGRFLIEERSFVYRPDVGVLGVAIHDGIARDTSLLCVGGVDFDRRGDDGGLASASSTRGSDPGAGPAPPVTRASGRRWSPLPGTLAEARGVARLHGETSDASQTLLSDADASEARLKRELERHAILHLATHGFFQPGPTVDAWTESLATPRDGLHSADPVALVARRLPGLLTGLVCSGANDVEGTTGEDALLTAEEVGWLDLSGAELVVMSACETGLGVSRTGQGLSSLRRAFHLAGARTVVSSLWAVPDDATAALIQGFYANLWRQGMAPSEALRSAQLARLAENRRLFGAGLPGAWGGFVLSGAP